MSDMVMMFQYGGWPMWLVLAADVLTMAMFLGLAPIALLFRGSVFPKIIAVFLALAAISPALIGVVGYTFSMSRVEEAIRYADPEFKEQLHEAGKAEAMYNIHFGTGSLCLTLPMAILGIALTMLSKPEPLE